MVGETKMNRNGDSNNVEPNVGRSFSGLAHDVVELSELQARLLLMDLRASSARLRTTAVIAVVGTTVLLGCVPVALLALAEVLVEQATWSRSLALGVSTLIGLAISGILFAVVWMKIRNGLSTFDRSRHEFAQNVGWMKSALRGHPAPPSPTPTNGSHLT